MSAIPSSFIDERHAEAVRWAADRLRREGLDFSVASADASFRRYFRARAGAESWIIMDAPPGQEDCRPFIDVAERLRQAGVPAPSVLACNAEKGFLLLSDLGMRTLLEVITPDNADRWFDEALDLLVRMQARTSADGLPAYDRALLMRELSLFPDWYLARHRGVGLEGTERKTWEAACERLVESALAQPRVFVHRDFMPRNLMAEEGLAVIDFQDAVRGPVTYDLLSLFKDAFLSWPEERVDAWVEDYRRRALAAGLPVPDDLRRAFDWMGLQRHLKVIGIFARLHYRDGKAKYLAETPRFFRYVYETAAKYAEFDDLLALMQQHERVGQD